MNLIELDSSQLVSKILSPEEGRYVRSSGLHLTDIIQGIADDTGRSKKRSDLGESELENYRAVGFCWERVLENVLSGIDEKLWRPGEVSMDGISCTPDGVSMGDDLVLEEFKCTWTSSKKSVEDRWQWWTQIKAYCHVLGLCRARLRVLYINGNWSPPIPRVRMYEAGFTPQELDENWQMLVQFAIKQGWLPSCV